VVLAGGIPGIVLGILLGLLIGGSRHLFIAVNPYVFAVYTTPFVALIPLYLVLFGVGFVGKVSIVFTLVFLAVIIQTIAGVRTVDPRFVEVAASFGSGWTRTLFHIKFPAASSLVVAGIRLAVGRALVGVVVAEFDTAFSGLGAEIWRHSQRFRLADALVPALVLAFFGILLASVLRKIEDRLERWRRVQ
jgi:ABC-type nitrate/sulfonate/bicarbonate transport system permease component